MKKMAAFYLVLLSMLYQSNAFSSVSSRAASQFGMDTRPRFAPPPSRSHSFSTLHFAVSDDKDESMTTNQTLTNSTNSEKITESSIDNENKKGFFGKVFGRGGTKFNKASLAKLGGSVLLSYGFVSNVFSITCVSCAWYIASRKVRT